MEVRQSLPTQFGGEKSALNHCVEPHLCWQTREGRTAAVVSGPALGYSLQPNKPPSNVFQEEWNKNSFS